MKKNFKIKNINYTPKKIVKAEEKENIEEVNLKNETIEKLQEQHLEYLKLKKIFNDNFKGIAFDNMEINMYKPKNEFVIDRDGVMSRLNISYPIKEEVIEKLIKNRININNENNKIFKN
jgi:hypothetical protein